MFKDMGLIKHVGQPLAFLRPIPERVPCPRRLLRACASVSPEWDPVWLRGGWNGWDVSKLRPSGIQFEASAPVYQETTPFQLSSPVSPQKDDSTQVYVNMKTWLGT